MKHRIKEIVLEEDRPFSVPDFRHFEVHDEEYEMSHGTFRNYLSTLKKQREIELAYRDGIGFYTIPGRGFAKLMTSDHMGGTSFSSSSLEAGKENSHLQMDKESTGRKTISAQSSTHLFYNWDMESIFCNLS